MRRNIYQTIYLLEADDHYKIGSTDDWDKRVKAYDTHTPRWTLIASFTGILKSEVSLHNLCKEFHYRGEWFKKSEEVLNIFTSYDITNDVYPEIENIMTTIQKNIPNIKLLNKIATRNSNLKMEVKMMIRGINNQFDTFCKLVQLIKQDSKEKFIKFYKFYLEETEDLFILYDIKQNNPWNLKWYE